MQIPEASSERCPRSINRPIAASAIDAYVEAYREMAAFARLSDYLPGFPHGDRITVRHLVEHTSGVPHTNRLDWVDMGTPLGLGEIVAGLAEEPLDFEPGTDSAYSNGGYALLAALIEAVSGQTFGDFLRAEFARQGFPSVGHEEPFEVIGDMAHRYAPGPVYGERVEAPVYVTANRIGGGSMYADAEDVWRFFRAAVTGELLAAETTAELFALPDRRRRRPGHRSLAGCAGAGLPRRRVGAHGRHAVLQLGLARQLQRRHRRALPGRGRHPHPIHTGPAPGT